MAASGRPRGWSDLSGGQQAAVAGAAVVELTLTAMALVDLARRPAAQVRGPKPLWVLACFVQPVGPIAYLALGRVTTIGAPRQLEG
jgi:hypothetical protein